MKKIIVMSLVSAIFLYSAGCGKNNPTGPGSNPTNTPAAVYTATPTKTVSATNTAVVTATMTPTNAPTVAIANAVDYNSVSWWTVGSPSALWFGNTVYYWPFGDTDAAQSGSLADNESSYIETTISGPGDLSWYVMTDTAAGDELRVYVDSSYTGLSASGLGKDINFWSQQSVHLPAGSHTIRWEYAKNASGSAGADRVWVDNVEFAVDTPAETATVTTSSTPADTGTSTFTRTATVTATISLTHTDSPTFTVTPTATVTLTNTDSPTSTATATATPTSTNTPYTMEFQYGSLPSASYNGTRDVRTSSGWPNYSFGGCNTLVTNTTNRSMIYFDVSLIPAGSTVVSAELIFTGYGGALIDMRAYEMSRSWSEDGVCVGASSGGATWNSYGAGLWTVPGGDYGGPQVGTGMIAASGQSTLTLSASMTQTWINTPSSNNGLMLLNWTGGGVYVEVYSKEDAAAANRPKLRIKYYTSGAPVSTSTINGTLTNTQTASPTVTFTPTLTFTATFTPAATADTRIIFSSFRDGGSGEIYIMQSDGSGQTRVTIDTAGNMRPSWSPGRNAILYATAYDIIKINPDGSGKVTIPMGTLYPQRPSWSPEGTKILFSGAAGALREIFAMNSDATGLVRLTNDLQDDYAPSWSPDGAKIAFARYDGVQYDAYVMNADGSGITNLTNNPANDFNPEWSPDGSKIVFYSNRDGNYEIYTMNANGSNPVNVSNNPALDAYPVWSPDGQKICFMSYRDGNYEIYTMNSDGSGQVNISNNSSGDWSPHWGTYSTFTGPATTPYPSHTFTSTLTGTNTATRTNTVTSTPTITATRTVTATATRTVTQTKTPVTAEFQQGILPDASYAGCSDTILISQMTGFSGGSCVYLETQTGTFSQWESLVKFDISSVPAGSTVLSAQLILYSYSGSNPVNVGVYKMLKNWAEDTVCYNNAFSGATWNSSGYAAWSSPGGLSGTDYESAASGTVNLTVSPAGNPNVITLSVPLVQGWVDGSSANYGVMIKGTAITSDYANACSKEYANYGWRPKLVVRYY